VKKKTITGTILSLTQDKTRLIIESTEIRLACESKYVLRIKDRYGLAKPAKKGKKK
jgi:hypothetical protein